MEKQLIISIGREFGSGGHVIAEALSKKFNIPMYDHNLLDHIAEEKNIPYNRPFQPQSRGACPQVFHER